MVFFAYLLVSVLLASASLATPVPKQPIFPPVPVTPKGLLCRLPIPIVQQFLCPRDGTSNPTVNTPLGVAHGVADEDNVMRFAVRYGQAARWQPSTMATSWQFPCVNHNKRLGRLAFLGAKFFPQQWQHQCIAASPGLSSR
jgi:hypothetical protein